MPKDYSTAGLLPITTTYHGHIILALPAKITYLDTSHPKVHYCTVEIIRRLWDPTRSLVYQVPYCKVKAWVGDNDTIHLMQLLPGETEDDMDLSVLFSVTPEQEDMDEQTRERELC